MIRKLSALLLVLILAGMPCSFAAWDASKPTDSEKLKDAPALIRANWAAIVTGTDANLQVTNAKVSPTAAIADTKLAQISTAGKVSGAALTSLASIPSGAGEIPTANIPTLSDSKLSQITTASKVSGAAITLLTSVPSGAGRLPRVNAPLVNTDMLVTLTDEAGSVLDASLGNIFTLTATADRTLGTTTNPTDGQKIIIRFIASSAARTLTLPTATTGDFAFGTDITALSQTASGKTDYIGCVYNSSSGRWHVVAYVKGF